MDEGVVCFREQLRHHIPNVSTISGDLESLEIEFYYPFTFQWFSYHGFDEKMQGSYFAIPVRLMYQFEKYSLLIMDKYRSHLEFKSGDQLNELRSLMKQYFRKFKNVLQPASFGNDTYELENENDDDTEQSSLRFRSSAYNMLFIYNKPIEKVKIMGTCCGCKYWGADDGLILTIDDCSIAPRDQCKRDDILCYVNSSSLILSGIASGDKRLLIGMKFLIYGKIGYSEFDNEILIDVENMESVISIQKEFEYYQIMERNAQLLLNGKPWFLPRETGEPYIGDSTVSQVLETIAREKTQGVAKRALFNSGGINMDEWLQKEFEMDFGKEELSSNESASHKGLEIEHVDSLSKKRASDAVLKLTLTEGTARGSDLLTNSVCTGYSDQEEVYNADSSDVDEDNLQVISLFSSSPVKLLNARGSSTMQPSNKPVSNASIPVILNMPAKNDILLSSPVPQITEDTTGSLNKITHPSQPKSEVFLTSSPTKDIDEHQPEQVSFESLQNMSLQYFNTFTQALVEICCDEDFPYVDPIQFQYKDEQLSQELSSLCAKITERNIQAEASTQRDEQLFRLKYENFKQNIAVETFQKFKEENTYLCLMQDDSQHLMNTSNMKRFHDWLTKRVCKIVALKLLNYRLHIDSASFQSIPGFKCTASSTVISSPDSGISTVFLTTCLEDIMHCNFDSKPSIVGNWTIQTTGRPNEVVMHFEY